MASLISISLVKSKMKGHTWQVGKNGEEYLPITISVNDGPDKFGNNCAAWVGQSKEEREAKAPKKYIANGRVVWGVGKIADDRPSPASALSAPEDDLPF